MVESCRLAPSLKLEGATSCSASCVDVLCYGSIPHRFPTVGRNVNFFKEFEVHFGPNRSFGMKSKLS